MASDKVKLRRTRGRRFLTAWLLVLVVPILLALSGVAVAALVAPAEPPCHEGHHAGPGEAAATVADRGPPCPVGVPGAGRCLMASCAVSALMPPAVPACPDPAFGPAASVDVRPRAGGPGVVPRPVLPPPRVA